ncbi:MAG: 2,3-bisphosphoglycerate-independent phosphoglycerate mutase [Vulcanimicrobiota bacterium]
MQAKKPLALIILDGFGLAPPSPGNAVAMASTPNFDRYWKDSPHTQLEASGRAVGLPEGQMGNSEVGHMNLGAGRVVMQSLTYISAQIEDGSFFENSVLNNVCRGVGPENSLHLMGLVSRGGVHSDLEHLFALLELTRRLAVPRVYIHAFTDGRDTPPDSGKGYLKELHDRIDALDHPISIATVIGRYYAMDRDRRWDRVSKAYNAIVDGEAEWKSNSALEAVEAAYRRGETDEFIKPTVIVDEAAEPVALMRDGDAVIFFNFRADRARQLSYALLGGPDWQEFSRVRRLKELDYASLMQYDEKLQKPYAFELPELVLPLPELLSRAGLRQYHSAETEKYPHVTYFFNALNEELYEGETRQMVPSPKVATYDLQPEMSAVELTAQTLERIGQKTEDFFLINYANPDMVGHTGVLAAAIKACEAADAGLGQLVEALLAQDGVVLVVADHGNAEVMIDSDGGPHTAHTTNPVPFIVIGAGPLELRSGGRLADVAPTILQLMGLDQPEAMTGKSLIL